MTAINSFREIINEKVADKLAVWIENSRALGISEIKSFINGLNQDIVNNKNAISLKYNNGLAEESVNKIKVIKRIICGRCSFDILRRKVISLESIK